MIGKLVLFALVALYSGSFSSATSNVVCYLGAWARYRTGNGQFTPAHIDTSLCTHVIYSFIGLNTNGAVISLDENLDYNLGILKAFTALKSTRSDLKLLIAIGGWKEGSIKFSAMAASPSLRATFIQSALEYVQKNNFDGFDFDWEYPAQRGGSAADVANFVTLLREFRAVFQPKGLLVTAAVSAAATSVATSYDVPGIAPYLDMINVMTYDLHGSYDGVTGHNAPLYASSKDRTAAALELNVDAAITNWIARGAAREKIVLGIPFYGRTFTLSTSDVSLGAPVSSGGNAGPITQEPGFLGYNEICARLNEGGWTYVWDSEQQVPHVYKGNQWIGYDDAAAIALKVKYAQDNKLGGVMIWSIETDDFLGLCGTKNLLLRTINTQMAAGTSGNSVTTTTAATTTASGAAATTTAKAITTTAATTTSTASSSNSGSLTAICSATGYVRSASDCSKFYSCIQDTTGKLVANEFTCPSGLYFDSSSTTCNWASLVTDCLA